MSTLRFEAEYVSGALIPETLTATPVTASASLTIGITRGHAALAATTTESATLGKVGTKPLSLVVSETAAVVSSKSETITSSISESAQITHRLARVIRATAITTNASVASGQLYSISLTGTVTTVASVTPRNIYALSFTASPIVESSKTIISGVRNLSSTPVVIAATNDRLQSVTYTLVAAPVTVTALSVRLAKAGIIVASPVFIVAVPPQAVRGIHFKILISETATLNKRGRYPQAPAVLQLYDTDTPYVLPILKGATVSYMNGILGNGVAFDIYAALEQAAFGLSYRDLIMAHVPVSYWKLDETTGTTAIDQTGTNPGTYTGGYILGQDGALNVDPSSTSVMFDGSTGAISIPNSVSLQLTNRYTLEAWVNVFDASAPGIIISQMGAVVNWQFNLTPAGNLVLSVDSLHSVQSNTGISFNRWVYVAATFDGSNVRFYINGSKEGTYPVTYDPSAQSYNSSQASVGPLGALLDEIAVCNHVLTDSMIKAHYDAATKAPVAGINSQFYVCDNGIKQALDRHPAVVRIQ